MDFVNRSSRNGQSNPNNPNTSNFGINFQLPSLQLDLNSLSEAFSQRNIASNLEELMAFTKSKDVGCDSCGNKFSFFKRKRTCADCNMDFCNGCLNKDVSDRKHHCKRCRVFNSVPLDRNALLGLRARDLKWFLASKRIPSQACKEKGELVDLIIQSISPQSNAFNGPNTSEYTAPEYTAPNSNNINSNSTERTNQNESFSPNTSTFVNENRFAANPSVNTMNLSQISDNSNNSSPSHSSVPNNTSETEVKKDQNVEQTSTYFNIDDLTSIEQLKTLNVKQLKLVLARNFIDFKGCVEKEELLARVIRLWNEKQDVKRLNSDEIPDANLCKICMESTIDCVLLECGHMVTCTNCGKRLSECPICRQYVIRVVHTFKA